MNPTAPTPQRVMVFIDHSNVFHRLCENVRLGEQWVKWYNPLKLAEHLVGSRNLAGVMFYCAPPPPYLLQDGPDKEQKYWDQMGYYGEIQKLSNVTLKFARLAGNRGFLKEKGLDTQLTADLISMGSQNLYDVAIILANDGDYVPGIESIKSLGRKVELVYFQGRASMDLMQHCDIKRRARPSFFEKLNFPPTR